MNCYNNKKTIYKVFTNSPYSGISLKLISNIEFDII